MILVICCFSLKMLITIWALLSRHHWKQKAIHQEMWHLYYKRGYDDVRKELCNEIIRVDVLKTKIAAIQGALGEGAAE